MEETIVYLPVPVSSEVEFGDCDDERIFYAGDVYNALNAAGVKWTQESPEELKIRMLKLQIEELKAECTRRGDCNASLVKKLEGAIEENSRLKQAYLELQDQNAALKMTISDKSKQIERLERGPNGNW